MKLRSLILAGAGALCLAAASDPAERLPDPAQEAHARQLFQQVRCVVCQNESIDDSEADLARDLRRIVREQVKAGHSDAQIKQFLVDRYGEFVLLKPSFSAANLALWLVPFGVVLGAGTVLLLNVRRSRADLEPAPLSAEEEAKIRQLTDSQNVGHAFAATPPNEKPEVVEG